MNNTPDNETPGKDPLGKDQREKILEKINQEIEAGSFEKPTTVKTCGKKIVTFLESSFSDEKKVIDETRTALNNLRSGAVTTADKKKINCFRERMEGKQQIRGIEISSILEISSLPVKDKSLLKRIVFGALDEINPNSADIADIQQNIQSRLGSASQEKRNIRTRRDLEDYFNDNSQTGGFSFYESLRYLE